MRFTEEIRKECLRTLDNVGLRYAVPLWCPYARIPLAITERGSGLSINQDSMANSSLVADLPGIAIPMKIPIRASLSTSMEHCGIESSTKFLKQRLLSRFLRSVENRL